MADRLQVANTQQQKKEFELSQEIEESQKKNKTLEDTKTAMLSILEDARQLEDDLKDERDKAKAIISAMSEGLIVVNESQTIILINPAGEKLLGLAENQIIGKKIDDVIQIYKGTQRLANSDRPVTKVFKTGKAITTTTSDDYFYQSAGRKRFPVLMTASPLMRDSIFGVVETFRDITDLRNYEDALQQAKTNIERKVEERTAQVQEEHARLEASIESLSAGFIMTDISYHAVMVNASAKRMLKLINYDAPHYGDMRSLLSINKQLILDLIEEKLGGVFSLKQHLQECLDTKKTMIIKDVLYEGRYFNIFIAPIIIYRAKIEAIGCVTLIEDVTEVKIIDRSKDEFFSIASHELRTPLTAIRGNTSMIKQFYADQLKDDDLKSMIDDIHESSIRLIKIVNDFLNTSRLEQGRMEFKKETFDLLELIRGSIADIESMLKEKNLYLKIENPQDLGHSIYADKDRVKEVVLNLFGNAMKFTEQGGITVHVTQHDQLIKVSITDTGKGVPLSNQSLLFRKFQQASNNILTRDTTRSTGLGLYISKLMIEGMGGKIYLERSEEGKGATFSFELPVDDSIDRKNETKEV
jgi:PAS domain S-box-containing protein